MTETLVELFDRKVDEFKRLYSAAPSLVTFGQFQVTNTVIGELDRVVRAELTAAGPTYNPVLLAYQEYRKNAFGSDYRKFADALLKLIKDNGWEAALPMTNKAFAPDRTASGDWAASQYGAVWTSPGITGVPAVSLASADKVKAAYDYEKDKCFRSARSMSVKLNKAQGSSLKHVPSNYSAGQIAQARLVPSGNRHSVAYDATGLGAAVGKIAAAVDRGYLYTFGVLSGVKQDSGPKFPTPEHYVVVFARHDSGAFLFWDPDANVSNIASRPWGPGFGVVYHRNDRLSTAYDQADFDAVGADGDHLQSPRRHCYQVYYADPIP